MALEQSNRDFADRTIQSFRDCRDICVETTMHGINVGGERSQMDVLGVLMDCADVCEAGERFMLRGSPFFKLIAPGLAEICDNCAAVCDTIPGDEYFATAAKASRRAAGNVRQLV